MASAIPAVLAAIGSKEGMDTAKAMTGMMGQIISALEKPIYTDTETVTLVSEGGRQTTVHTKGWSIPLGLPLGIVLFIMAWETGNAIAQAVNQTDQGIADVAWYLDPSNWLSLVEGGGPGTKSPPSFMASLSRIGIQLMQPGGALMAYANAKVSEVTNK